MTVAAKFCHLALGGPVIMPHRVYCYACCVLALHFDMLRSFVIICMVEFRLFCQAIFLLSPSNASMIFCV